MIKARVRYKGLPEHNKIGRVVEQGDLLVSGWKLGQCVAVEFDDGHVVWLPAGNVTIFEEVKP